MGHRGLSAHTVVRLLESGGLDGRFFAHNEEIDLCWRLHQMGKRIYCFPESEVYHLGGGTLPKTNSKKTFLNFRNNLTMLYKNLPDNELKKRDEGEMVPRLSRSFRDSPHQP